MNRFGPPTAVSPPIVYGSSGTPTFYARENIDPALLTRGFRDQTRTLQGIGRSDCEPSYSADSDGNGTKSQADNSACSGRYEKPVRLYDARLGSEEGDTDHSHWLDPSTKDDFFGLSSQQNSNDEHGAL